MSNTYLKESPLAATKLQQFEYNQPSNAHRAQDAVRTHSFCSGSRRVWVGVICDGCSNVTADDVHGHDKTFTEYGSRWMAAMFCQQAEFCYQSGLRNTALMRAVLLGLAKAMLKYEPARTKSGFRFWNNTKISDELVATLYGYIADDETTVIGLAGDGEVVCNDFRYFILQKDSRGETGDNYPINLLFYPQSVWEEHLEKLYAIEYFDTAAVGRLALASDGLCKHVSQLLRSGTANPAHMHSLVAHEHRQALREGYGTRDLRYCSPNEDDASFVGFSNSTLLGVGHELPEVARVCKQAINERGVYDFIPAWREPTRRSASGSTDDLYIDIGGRMVSWCDYGPEGQHGDRTVFASDTLWIFKTSLSDDNRIVKGFLTVPLAAAAISRLTALKESPIWKDLGPLCAHAEPANMLLANGEYKPFGIVFSQYGEQVSLVDFCDYVKSRDKQWGLKACVAVLLKLHRLVCKLHENNVSVGNLRPQDVLVTVKRTSARPDAESLLAPLGKKFSLDVSAQLANPEVWAVQDPEGGIVRPHWDLDESNVHPQLLASIRGADLDAMRLQDWFSFSQIVCQVLTKCDPFLEGVISDSPERSEDRVFRMSQQLPAWSDSVDTGNFFRTAMARLSEQMRKEIERTISLRKRSPFRQAALVDLYNSLLRCPGCFLQQHADHKLCQNPECHRRLKKNRIRKKLPVLSWRPWRVA